MKKYDIILSDNALLDLKRIYTYVEESDSATRAKYVVDKIIGTLERLNESPERGVYPKELLDLGVRDFREVFFKPYRIFYQVFESRVIVHLVADGRRDMRTLLTKRLLGG